MKRYIMMMLVLVLFVMNIHVLAEEQEITYQQIKMGEIVQTEDFSITFEEAAVAESITVFVDYDGDTSYVVEADQEQCQLVYVMGKLELSDKDMDVYEIYGLIKAEFILDEEQTANAVIITEYEGAESIGREFRSNESQRIWLYAEVDDHTIQNNAPCVARVSIQGIDYELDLTPDALTEFNDKDTIKSVQNALNSIGYECGTPDGVSGSKTQNAISAYQQDNGLTETGTITYETLLELRNMGLDV